jgi:hypothetical protein
MKKRIYSVFGRAASDQSGLALTEFALSLPILMIMGVGFVDLAGYINAHNRISQIALSVADNGGRVKQRIDELDVDTIMIGAKIAGETIDFAENGRVFLSMVEHNGKSGTDEGQQITWQRCFGAKNVTSTFGVEGSGANNADYDDGFGPNGNKIMATSNAGVMFVEVVYDYQPIFMINETFVNSLKGATIRATAAYPVRERATNQLQNAKNSGDSDPTIRKCNKYAAV